MGTLRGHKAKNRGMDKLTGKLADQPADQPAIQRMPKDVGTDGDSCAPLVGGILHRRQHVLKQTMQYLMQSADKSVVVYRNTAITTDAVSYLLPHRP